MQDLAKQMIESAFLNKPLTAEARGKSISLYFYDKEPTSPLDFKLFKGVF